MDLAKEVLVYHAIVDYIKTIEKIATPESSLCVMLSGYGQERGGYKIIKYSMKKWQGVTVEGMKKYVTEKYADILKTEKEFQCCSETIVPNMLYLYNLYTKCEDGRVGTTRLNYH